MIPCRKGFILVRGAGDIATGVILRLVHAGFRVAALETEKPTAIRRTVALSEAVYDGEAQVENIRARRIASPDELLGLLGFLELPGLPGLPSAFVPILVDPDATSLEVLRPEVLVDAILAKRNTGTSIGMAPLTIALGPGFEAAVDVHFVVETNRGHTLGRVIASGSAEPDTGIPGEIGGFARERVLKSPIAGIVEPLCAIGDKLRSGDPLLAIHAASGDRERIVLVSPFDGIVRGLLRSGFEVTQGFKIADVDPRCRPEHCRTVSDKALAIAGGVLEAVMAAGLRPPIWSKAGDMWPQAGSVNPHAPAIVIHYSDSEEKPSDAKTPEDRRDELRTLRDACPFGARRSGGSEEGRCRPAAAFRHGRGRTPG